MRCGIDLGRAAREGKLGHACNDPDPSSRRFVTETTTFAELSIKLAQFNLRACMQLVEDGAMFLVTLTDGEAISTCARGSSVAEAFDSALQTYCRVRGAVLS